MKIWMSQSTKQNNKYTARNILPLFGIVLLLPFLMIGISLLSAKAGLPKELSGLIACLGVTALMLYVALKLGNNANRDAQIFCQDDAHDLFVVNARNFTNYHRGIFGAVKMSSDTQKVLTNLKDNHILERYMSQEKSLNGLATKIISVESMKPNNKGCIARCKVSFPNGNIGKSTYIISDGYDNQNELITAFERKRGAYSP